MLSHLVCSCLKINLFSLTDESNQVSLLLINLISYKWQKMTIVPWYPIFPFSPVISFLSVSWANGFPVKDSISQTPLQWGAALWLSSSQWEVGGREMCSEKMAVSASSSFPTSCCCHVCPELLSHIQPWRQGHRGRAGSWHHISRDCLITQKIDKYPSLQGHEEMWMHWVPGRGRYLALGESARLA